MKLIDCGALFGLGSHISRVFIDVDVNRCLVRHNLLSDVDGYFTSSIYALVLLFNTDRCFICDDYVLLFDDARCFVQDDYALVLLFIEDYFFMLMTYLFRKVLDIYALNLSFSLFLKFISLIPF